MTITNLSAETLPEVQLAAGGLVWQCLEGVPKLAVIHRPKYDDWTLPKGKPNPNEALAETARREVQEELGCDAKFLEFAGTIHYPRGDGQLKLVLFWHMIAQPPFRFIPNDEVDEVLWLTPAEALRKLDHRPDIEFLGRISAPVQI